MTRTGGRPSARISGYAVIASALVAVRWLGSGTPDALGFQIKAGWTHFWQSGFAGSLYGAGKGLVPVWGPAHVSVTRTDGRMATCTVLQRPG